MTTATWHCVDPVDCDVDLSGRTVRLLDAHGTTWVQGTACEASPSPAPDISGHELVIVADPDADGLPEEARAMASSALLHTLQHGADHRMHWGWQADGVLQVQGNDTP